MKPILKSVNTPQTLMEDAVVKHYVPSAADLPRTEIRTADLTRGPQLVVWSIRKWLQSRRDKHRRQAVAYRTAYRMAGISEAAEILDEMMMVLATGSFRPVLVECACCRQLSTDEVLLLRTLRSLQLGKIDVARRRIQRLLPGALAHAFCRSANAYVDLLNRADLSLGQMTELALVNQVDAVRPTAAD